MTFAIVPFGVDRVDAELRAWKCPASGAALYPDEVRVGRFLDHPDVKAPRESIAGRRVGALERKIADRAPAGHPDFVERNTAPPAGMPADR